MARDTTISPSAAGPSVISAEGGVIDVTRLRVALARLSRRLRRHELAGLTPTQLAALSTVEQAGPLRLGDLAAAEGIAPSTLTRLVAALEELGLRISPSLERIYASATAARAPEAQAPSPASSGHAPLAPAAPPLGAKRGAAREERRPVTVLFAEVAAPVGLSGAGAGPGALGRL